MTSARLAARCVELLGRVDGPIAVTASRRVRDAVAARVPVARDEAPIAGAVCVLLGTRADPAARAAAWEALAARLAPGAPLVVADHNQPRAVGRRIVGALVLAFRGLAPVRARHPVAREVRDHGFTIEALRLDAGERVQLVRARRRPH